MLYCWRWIVIYIFHRDYNWIIGSWKDSATGYQDVCVGLSVEYWKKRFLSRKCRVVPPDDSSCSSHVKRNFLHSVDLPPAIQMSIKIGSFHGCARRTNACIFVEVLISHHPFSNERMTCIRHVEIQLCQLGEQVVSSCLAQHLKRSRRRTNGNNWPI